MSETVSKVSKSGETYHHHRKRKVVAYLNPKKGDDVMQLRGRIREACDIFGVDAVGSVTEQHEHRDRRLDERPGWLQLLSGATTKGVDGIVVLSPNDVSSHLADLTARMRALHRVGLDLLIAEPRIDGGEDSTSGWCDLVLGPFVEVPASTILPAGMGRPPFGTRSVGGVRVVDPHEHATLQRMHQLYQETQSLRATAEILMREKRLPRRGRWHPRTIGELLRREFPNTYAATSDTRKRGRKRVQNLKPIT